MQIEHHLEAQSWLAGFQRSEPFCWWKRWSGVVWHRISIHWTVCYIWQKDIIMTKF